MAKKFTVEGEVVEENDFYKVIKSDENGKFYIFSKNSKEYSDEFNDSCYIADKYEIIGSAVLEDNNGNKYYSNYINRQAYGQGRCLVNRFEIDAWKTKVIDGVEQTVVKYFDEKGYKYIRYVDEQGNLYKKQKKQAKQLQTNDDLTI